MISSSSIVVAVRGQVSSDLGEEVVILHLRDGMYYGLDAIGARIWDLIQEPKAVSEIRDVLLGEYEVEPEDCESDVLALLEELAAKDLVETKDGAGS